MWHFRRTIFVKYIKINFLSILFIILQAGSQASYIDPTKIIYFKWNIHNSCIVFFELESPHNKKTRTDTLWILLNSSSGVITI